MKQNILLIMLALTACSTRPKAAPSVDTGALTGHLDRIQSNLSRVDGKSLVIKSWLETH